VRKLFIIFLFLTFSSVFGKTSKVDSLKNLLTNADPDTSYVLILNGLADEYRRDANFQELFNYASEALEISERISYQPGQVRSLLQLGIYFRLIGNSKLPLDYYYKALALSRNTNDGKSEVTALNAIAVVQRETEDYIGALEKNRDALQICRDTGDELGMALCFYENGLVLQDMFEFKKAKDNFLQALEIYEMYNEKNEIAACYLSLSKLYKDFDDYEQAMSYLTLAENMYKNSKKEVEIKGLIEVYLEKGSLYRFKADYPGAIQSYKRTIQICQSHGDSIFIGDALNELGSIYSATGNIDTALIYFNEALEFFQKLGKQYKIGVAYKNMAELYSNMGMLGNSLDYYFIAVTIFEKIDNQKDLADAKSAMGIIYLGFGEYAMAKDCLLQGLEIWKKTGPQRKYAEALDNLALYYSTTNNLDSALLYYDLTSRICQEIQYTELLSEVYLDQGLIFCKQSEYNQALAHLKDALTLAQSMGDKKNICNSLLQIYDVYTMAKKDNIDLGFSLLELGFDDPQERLIAIKDIAGELKNNNLISKSHESLIDFYKSTNNLSEALFYADALIIHLDSVSNFETERAISAITTKYEFEKKDKEIALLTKDKEIQKLALAKQVFFRNTLIISSLVLLLLAIGLFNRFRYIKKTNRIIREERERAEEQKRKAVESENFKEQFLTSMSHEIRTPLNAIVGITRILRRNKQLPEQEEYLDAIGSSSNNLLKIVNDILDLSKLEVGKMEIESIPFNLLGVITDVVNILKFKAEEKGIKLESEINNEIPIFFKGDPSRLEQILINIIGNAIKFTEKGGVTLTVDKNRNNTKEVLIRFIVSDTGIGIPEHRLNNIFESFVQADNGTSRKYGGSGLGLTISKQLLDLLGGKIEVRSEVGKGSSFILDIPYSLCDIKIDHKAGIHSPIPILEGLKILVVEDNAFNAMVVTDELKTILKDAEIDVAENGKVAYKMIAKKLYDIILMDVVMPEMDGYQATRIIRNMKNSKSQIPIIAMTANVLKPEVENCFKAGMNDYIAKPFDPEILLHKIYTQVRKTINN